MNQMDIDAALAQLEQHEAAVNATRDDKPDDDGLLKDINNVFDNVTRQQRLDKGREHLVIKSFDA